MAQPYSYSRLETEATSIEKPRYTDNELSSLSDAESLVDTTAVRAPSKSRHRRIFTAILYITTHTLAFFAGRYLNNIRWKIDVQSALPQLPTIPYVFQLHEIYSKGPANASLAAWNELIPNGGGFVRVPEYPGAPPSQTLDDVYSLAVYHQLHCLNLIRKAYQPGSEDPIDKENSTFLPPLFQQPSKIYSFHYVHCIDYLRQSILCNPDVTLEPFDHKKNGTASWGVTHQCKDISRLDRWAEESRLFDWKDING